MPIELKDISMPIPHPTYSDIVNNGPTLTPQKRIQLYDNKEWEIFVEEYAYGLKKEYHTVRRAGGAGDQGIDVAAFRTDTGIAGSWDNYQCKHYNAPLSPTDIYLELGKLCYYTFIGEYTVPENYYFIAPQGVGTTLAKLLRGNHEELKKSLLAIGISIVKIKLLLSRRYR